MFVYKVTNRINGKVYVGQTKSSNERYLRYYLGSGKVMKWALSKYGRHNFIREVICECSSIEELNFMEEYWIKKLGTQNPNVGYNVANGGLDSGYHSKNTINIISKKSTNRRWINNGIQEKIIPEEDLVGFEKMGWVVGRKSIPWSKGKPMDKATREKISVANKNKKAWNKGKQLSDETKKKISQSKQGGIPWNKGLTKESDSRVHGMVGKDNPMYGKTPHNKKNRS